MFPTVSKIILIIGAVPRLQKIFGQRNFPAGKRKQIALKWLVVGNPNLVDLTSFGIGNTKHVKMIIDPTHRILNRDMQIPEIIACWHLNPAPYRWLDFLKTYFELISQLPGIHDLAFNRLANAQAKLRGLRHFDRAAARFRLLLGSDNFVQPFDDLCQFFGHRTTQSLADSLDGKSANLADLAP